MKTFIYFEEEFLGVYPSLINAITLLSPSCSKVEVISSERKSNFPNPPKFPVNVVFHKVRQNFVYDRNQFEANTPSFICNQSKAITSSFWRSFLPESLKIKYRKFRDLIVHNIHCWENQYHWFLDKIKYYSFCLYKTWSSRPDILIAVDNSGLIAASIVCFLSRTNPILVFWSLEIDTGKSPLVLRQLHDLLFSRCVRFADILVIQENSRVKVLGKKLNIDFKSLNTFLIPHSPIAFDKGLHRNEVEKSQFFQKKFSLSGDEKIILHAGWIHDAMCVDRIAEVAKAWKSSYKIVLHERERRSQNEPFIRHVCQLSENRVLLSLDAVSFDRMDEVFSSAHIGIIAYDKKYGGGRENAHKASGKLGQYLKCGVPVIALDLPGYAEMFQRYRCGMVFQNFEEIEDCIDRILQDYESFQTESLRCFEEEFDFKKYFNPLLDHLIVKSTSIHQ